MKSNTSLKKLASLCLIFCLVLSQIQCGLSKKHAISIHEHPEFNFNQNYKYKILTANYSDPSRRSMLSDKKYQGSELYYNPYMRTIETNNGRVYQINEWDSMIEYTNQKQGRHWALGMGIGAGVGTAIGVAIITSAMAYTGSDCQDSGECKAMAGAVAILMTPISIVTGTLIGLGIGALIPKKKKVLYVP